MTPSQLSAQLRRIATKISSYKHPRRDLNPRHQCKSCLENVGEDLSEDGFCAECELFFADEEKAETDDEENEENED